LSPFVAFLQKGWLLIGVRFMGAFIIIRCKN
jgi:hypothetical protein